MGNLKLNSVEEYEPIGIIKLDKDNYPIAFNNKVEELLEEGAANSREEAEKIVNDIEFELELYYHKGYGLFAVESEAVESGTIYSPYNKELADDSNI